MASVTRVRLVDDLDGGEADESVSFALDGKSFEIDLSAKRAAELRGILAPYAGAARRAGGSTIRRRRGTGASSPRRDDTAAIREWATAHGHQVSARGRISAAVIQAYESRGTTAALSTANAAGVEAEAKPKQRRPRKKVANPFATGN
ncbi:histone-like nucleoid-structuring protein Lsr2 [Pseudonocardia sp. CA-142604]|uniref:histone-like nucleoid-structuring protein Lsr2 n=1 Tax=Pseudonocardia sp. CA-142604 TaxID=3240024 RepID=UPI003D8F773F